MSNTPFPARYFSHVDSGSQATFLLKALKASPSDQRPALLECVDWNTPDVRLSAPWQASPDQLQAELVQVHPLSTVAQVGDEELFARALELAQAKEVVGLGVGERRDMVVFSDWVTSKVLSSVCAHGSPASVKLLVDTLATRLDHTRQIDVVPGPRNGYGTSPWKAMALFGSREASLGHYQSVLAEVDRFARIQLRSNLRSTSGESPRMDGGGRLNRWEKDLRARVYSMALLEACRHGNEPMFEAVLEAGHAQPSLAHVHAAVIAGAGDLALRLVEHPLGLSRWFDQPLLLKPAHQSFNTIGDLLLDPGELMPREVAAVLIQAGKSFQAWQELDKEHPAHPFKENQQECLVEVTSKLLGLWRRFPAEANDIVHLSDKVAQCLLPMLLTFDEKQAIQAEDALVGTDRERIEAGVALPDLIRWDLVLDSEDSPWAKRLMDRVANLCPKSLRGYLEALEVALFSEWGDWDPESPPENGKNAVDRFIRVWPTLSTNPHVPDFSAWMEGKLEVGARGRVDLESWVQSRILDSRLSASPAQRKAAPRL